MKFDGKIDEHGKMTLYDQESFVKFKDTLRGKGISLGLDKGNKRSNAQNSYYWGVIIAMITEHTGQDADDVHEFLKGKFNAVEFEIPNKETGEIIEQAKIGRTTTKMTTIQFKEYVEQIQQWASVFLGVVIPDPGQSEWLEE